MIGFMIQKRENKAYHGQNIDRPGRRNALKLLFGMGSLAALTSVLGVQALRSVYSGNGKDLEALADNDLPSASKNEIPGGFYVNLAVASNHDNVLLQKDVVGSFDIPSSIYLTGKDMYRHVIGPFADVDDARKTAEFLLDKNDFLDTIVDPELGIIEYDGGKHAWKDIISSQKIFSTTQDYAWLQDHLKKKGYPLQETLETIADVAKQFNSEILEYNRKTDLYNIEHPLYQKKKMREVSFDLASAFAYVESSYDPSRVAKTVKDGKLKILGQGLFQTTAERAIDIIKNYKPLEDELIDLKFYGQSEVKDLAVYRRHGTANKNGRSALERLKKATEPGLKDAYLSARLGIANLGMLLEQFDDDLKLVAAAYNGGPGCTRFNDSGLRIYADARNAGYQETRDYIGKINAAFKQIKSRQFVVASL